LAVAGRPACYDGTLGARSMHALQSHGEDRVTYDNKAYTITSIFNGGQLKMFTSHPYQRSASGTGTEYCMHQLDCWAMTGNAQSFRKGVTAYRNARDWAQEQMDALIEQANIRHRSDGRIDQEPIPSFANEVATTTTVEHHSKRLRSRCAAEGRRLRDRSWGSWCAERRACDRTCDRACDEVAFA
jgi:hypothetical protein